MPPLDQALAQASELHGQGHLAEARAIYQRILAQDPRHALACHQLGVLEAQCGQVASAIERIRLAINLLPEHYLFHVNMGMILEGADNFDQALESYSRAVQLNPSDADLHYKLGNALRQVGRLPEAIASFTQAVHLDPAHSAALNNLANGLRLTGRTQEAIACLQSALQLNPSDYHAMVNLAGALSNLDRYAESIALYQRVTTLQSQDAAFRPVLAGACSCLAYARLYDPAADRAAIAAELAQWNRMFALPLADPTPHDNLPAPDRPLRIGYVSPDFRDHVVGRNLLPLMRHHDLTQYEVFCYCNDALEDGITAEFRRLAQQFHVIHRASDPQVADRIRTDRIDILVDLSLHTAGNRLEVFARRPAPVQVTFAGYPGSTGLTAIDYRLTDPHLDPPGPGDASYVEQSQCLSASFWCFDPLDAVPPVMPLPALTSRLITFGCLNNFRKINDGVLQLWTRVLQAVPGSRLMLLAAPGSPRQRTSDFFARAGIAPERILFPDKRPRDAYLRLYHDLDIGLDSFPYNGHTTSLDSTFMGVPVVTLVGRTVVGRAGLSQLTNLGITELIAHTPEDYLRIAVDLAGDLPRLAALRSNIRERMQRSPLMDAPRFARDIEAIYRAIWRKWCAAHTAPP